MLENEQNLLIVEETFSFIKISNIKNFRIFKKIKNCYITIKYLRMYWINKINIYIFFWQQNFQIV